MEQQSSEQTTSKTDSAKLLAGQVALVTGASRGIGAATAILLARHGAAVAVNYVQNQTAAESVVEQISAEGGKAMSVQADVGDEHQVREMVQRVNQTLGPVDILILNATAVQRFYNQPFVQFNWADFEGMVAGELKGAFYPCQAVVPSMIEHKRGSIVGISSGLSRNPMEGSSAHSTGKSGLDAFMKSLALELGPHGIRVNTVAPGLVETDATRGWRQGQPNRSEWVARSTPLRRIAQPEDIAGAVLLLASPHAQFITGTYVPVSGGIQMI
jgi:3-oxoacyl-[acyl-carrier protein] reductase